LEARYEKKKKPDEEQGEIVKVPKKTRTDLFAVQSLEDGNGTPEIQIQQQIDTKCDLEQNSKKTHA